MGTDRNKFLIGEIMKNIPSRIIRDLQVLRDEYKSKPFRNLRKPRAYFFANLKSKAAVEAVEQAIHIVLTHHNKSKIQP